MVSACAAHILAWAVGAFFVFVPAYQGESVASATPGEPGGEVIRHSATLIEANGLYAIALLLVPVLLTGVALLSLRLTTMSQIARKVLLWGPAFVLLGFCVAAIFSIGVFYLPAAFALLVATYADFSAQETNA